MADTPEFLVTRLIEEGEKVSRFFKGLAPHQWETQVYSDGNQWTVRQILAHFDVTETNIARLIRDILAGGSGAPEGFVIDAFNERTVAALQDLPADDLLVRFAAHRQKTVDLVSNLSGEDLIKTGRHPYLGITRLVDIIKLMYVHNQTHLRDIRRVISV
jgi:hypothetical protein